MNSENNKPKNLADLLSDYDEQQKIDPVISKIAELGNAARKARQTGDATEVNKIADSFHKKCDGTYDIEAMLNQLEE